MEEQDKKKYLPVILMLLGGLITVVVTFIQSFSILAKLGSLIAVMAVMYFVGTLIVVVLRHFDKVNFEKEEAERKAREELESIALATDGNVEEKEEL
ncbi:MAG: hypothetical protein K5669_00250 [Lachnospiraceae bacterium]|nr:hypothetical protein [Lachnospiraceae bacterium]